MCLFVLNYVCLLGYGVAAQSLLFPLREIDDETFENVLFRPYFQIYGALCLWASLSYLELTADCMQASCFWRT